MKTLDQIKTRMQIAGFLRPVPVFKGSHKIKRGTHNGYVAFNPDLLHLSTEEIDKLVDIHGGITFDGYYKELDQYNDISKVIFYNNNSFEIPDNFRVLGFDTCHLGDDKVKWNEKKVITETRRFMYQLRLIIRNNIRTQTQEDKKSKKKNDKKTSTKTSKNH